jgi:hypothetical protein
MIYSVGIDFHKDQHRARCLDARALASSAMQAAVGRRALEKQAASTV